MERSETLRNVRRPPYDVIFKMPRPLWRGAVHAAATAVSIPASAILVVLSHGVAVIATTIYSVSLVATLSISAIYHRLTSSLRAQLVFRRADHACIFMLIAGTYTPVCLLGLPPHWGIPLLIAVWCAAIAGAITKIAHVSNRIAHAAYIAMGWAAVPALPALWSSAGPTVVYLIAVGGIIYTLGAVGFATHRPRLSPSTFGYHEVWHVATVLAAGFHFGAIAALAG